MELDFDRCYRAVDSRDQRFDGWFVTAVSSTGIYCRPSCPAIRPRRENVAFYPTAAAAHRLGFRACRRCRPDAAPGSPDWDVRADVVGRAMRLISDGVVDRDGVDGLATRLGYTTRHLHRMLVAEVGAGPLALARAQRAQTARTLIETTDLGLADIAFAAGFGSVRQFNDTVREVYATQPSELRQAARRQKPVGSGTITVRLAHRAPFHAASMLEFLALRAIPGVEIVTSESYTRAMRLPYGTAHVRMVPADGHIAATLRLADVRDLSPAVARCRRLFDLDADPTAIDGVLGADPALATAVAAEPGVRVPRAVDGFEVAVRAIINQQISVAGAITVLGRLVAAAPTGDAIPTTPDGAASTDAAPDDTDSAPGDDAPHTGRGLRPFPDAATVAKLPDGAFPMPKTRIATIRALAEAVASDQIVLDGSVDRDETRAALEEIPGIGPWTANYVAMRALGDPDVFLGSDLGVLRAAAAAGLPETPTRLIAHAKRWAPWRSYAVVRLWRM
ncbi:MAG TPA: AlkA N-terminal domain-containing protein [Micromonosporaceae bacterium]|nr:AlkA N-terminal domain-containing protein [Micromonosporaceae bacterium]